MKVYESGIVYKKTYEGMTEEGFRATFVITYITLEIKRSLFGIKRKFKINQRSEGLSNYSEALKLNKAYDLLNQSLNSDGDWRDLVENYEYTMTEVMNIILETKKQLTVK